MPTDAAVVVVQQAGTGAFAALRTLRRLARWDIAADVIAEEHLARHLGTTARPVWLLRAGAWPLSEPRRPPPSATGRTLVAFGATAGDAAWTEIVTRTGGDLARAARLPWFESVLVDEPHRLAHRLERDRSLDAACRDLVASSTRAVRIPSLDVGADPSLRVLEVVTTLHRGGAERVVLDLVAELRDAGVHVRLAVMDHAMRAAFPPPDGTVELADVAEGRAARVDALTELALEESVDVVHVHLLDAPEIRRVSRCGVPVVVTVHNDRPGWPAELTSLTPDHVSLLVGCSGDVSRALAEDVPALASRVRTVWNGIRPSSPSAGTAFRRELGIADDALVLLAVANHRPQKRLERLPDIVAALVSRGHDAHAVLAGEPVNRDPVAVAIGGRIRAAAAARDVTGRVHLVGTHEDVALLYGAADVVVSTSAFEGLSLAQLEAMRARVPLVTTAVSGTAEIAALHEGVVRVPVDASADVVADAVVMAVAGPDPAGLAAPLSSRATARRHAMLLARAATSPVLGHEERTGLVLVANNFATGGAQSSARRLLTTLAAAGVRVAAVVIQEQAAHPSAGRVALASAGIPVFVAPRAGAVDPAATAEAVARFVDGFAPAAVAFWNVITQHKVLVAELLVGMPVWDVSPGEMCFDAMARYFEAPRAGHPVRDARAYGSLLAGAIVKYEAERSRAEDVLGTTVHVVANGVPVGGDARPARERGEDRARVVLGTLARINPDKKLEQLVDAVRHVVTRDAELGASISVRVAGAVEEGCEAYAAELRARADGLPVTFVGERDATAFLGELDLFVMVSEPSGCPNASLEAMAEGLAVVATDVGGARDQILDGVTGLLVPRADVTALGDAIASLARDPTRRATMGDAGRARARERFSVARMAADYARLLLGVSMPGPARADAAQARPHGAGEAGRNAGGAGRVTDAAEMG